MKLRTNYEIFIGLPLISNEKIQALINYKARAESVVCLQKKKKNDHLPI